MTRIFAIGSFALAAAIACALAGAAFSKDEPRTESARLAARLGDRDYRDREAAGKRLDDLGAESLPALRTVAESGSLEASERARGLIAKIERRIDNAKAIAGTVVELKAEEQTLADVLKSIKKQSGCDVQIDRTFRSNRVTTRAGKVLFWVAVQTLAADVGLDIDSAMLRKTGTPPNSACVSGAFRIEAVPIPETALPRMPAHRVSVLLRVLPEPRLAWLGTLETLVLVARDQDGHALFRDFLTPDRPRERFHFSSSIPPPPSDPHGFDDPGEYSTATDQAYVKLLAHPDGTSRKLATLEGIIRGKIRGEPEALVTVAGLGADFADAEGPDHLSLQAKYEGVPGEPSVWRLTVVTAYRWSDVSPHGEAGGLSLVDECGKPMKLTLDGSVKRDDSDAVYRTHVETASFLARHANSDSIGQPAKVTFTGTRVKTVEVPFKLGDVPVPRGLGTEEPSPTARSKW